MSDAGINPYGCGGIARPGTLARLTRCWPRTPAPSRAAASRLQLLERGLQREHDLVEQPVDRARHRIGQVSTVGVP